MKYFGYIDPGTGSLFVQAILGTILAGVFVLRNFFRQLIAKIRFASSRTATRDEEV
jgi:hypothetical protein